MTMDGAGNMAGKQAGCAARFTQLSPKALYHYCSSHDLNLALCKCCSVREIHAMLDIVTQLGIFFKYSPKRSRRLEEAVLDANQSKCSENEKIVKRKVGIFCETRWIEKHTTLSNFMELYEPIVACLDAIGSIEADWDSKTSTAAYGLLKSITDHAFIVSFHIVRHFFGYVKGLSAKLQGSTLDVIQGYEMVTSVRAALNNARQDDSEWEHVFQKATKMAETAGAGPITAPRICSKQIHRSNTPAATPDEHFKRNIYLPFLDSLLQQFSLRFGDLAKQAIRGLSLIPSNVSNIDALTADGILHYYHDDLPSPDSFHQELKLWQQMWRNADSTPSTLSDTLADSRSCRIMYPNITTIIHILLLTSVTACSVERANSSLRFVKSCFRSTMNEDRFNALILLFVHKDIKLDIDDIINAYARKHPRRMTLLNPLACDT
jgi:hypothetical protein